jgi:hypothetical protein
MPRSSTPPGRTCNRALITLGSVNHLLPSCPHVATKHLLFINLFITKHSTLHLFITLPYQTFLEARDHSPESPELLTTIGLLYLRLGENKRAFDFL